MATRRNILLAIGVLLVLPVFGQQGYQFISHDYNRNLAKHINSAESNLHSQIQPYWNAGLVREVNPDSLRGTEALWLPWSQNMYLQNRVPDKRQFRLKVYPMVQALGGVDITESQTRGTFETGLGVGVGGDVGSKFSFYADVRAQHGQYPGYVQQYADSLNVIPGMGFARWDGRGYSNWDYSGYLSYSPLEPFNLQAGVGKNHWGDGIRSLVLSDQATNYPFFKITTSIWNIKYISLFNVMYDIRGSSGDYGKFGIKYSTMHFLSWNISKRVNVSLWESVVWQNEDNGNYRGFDINYLNPIIFFRPVEYAQGSSDRVTLGTNFSVKVGGNTKLFGQIALDEFLLDSLLAGNGWFGNKHALQVGAKTYDAFNVSGLDLRAEFNLVRPFFYQHVSVKQNHAHFNEPLAHTLGNNFFEGIVAGSYQRNRWAVDGRILFAQYGRNKDTLNLGGDIFVSDVAPHRPVSGHRIGQGLKHWLMAATFRVGYVIDQQAGLRLEFSYTPRYLRVEGDLNYTHFIQIGLRTTLWNRNRFF